MTHYNAGHAPFTHERSRRDFNAEIAHARFARFAHLLDNSIPLPGGYRIGLDGIVGLIPGIGDLAGAAASSYLVVLAARTGVPTSVLLLMVYNIVTEMVFGSIPVVGDIFDFVWKANERNLELYEEFHAHPYKGRQKHRLKAALPLLGLLGILTIAGFLAVAMIKLIIRLVGGV